MLDGGQEQDGEPYLAGTARPVTALLSPTTAADLGVRLGETITVTTERGAVSVPAASADLPYGVVWLPGNSGPVRVRRSLGVGHGAVVTVTATIPSVTPAGGTDTNPSTQGDRP